MTSVDWDWTRVVFDHVHLGVREASKSVDFYKTVLGPLAIPPLWERENGAQFANLVVSDDRPPGGPVHIAFVADSREQVDAFHRAGIEAGYRDNGAPGVREQYSSEYGGRYHAAFLLDPDRSSQLTRLARCNPFSAAASPQGVVIGVSIRSGRPATQTQDADRRPRLRPRQVPAARLAPVRRDAGVTFRARAVKT